MTRDLLAYGLTTFYAGGASVIGNVSFAPSVVTSFVQGTGLYATYGATAGQLANFAPIPSVGLSITGPSPFAVLGASVSITQYLTQGYNNTQGA